WQPGPVLGWSPGGRQGRRMIDGRLTDSTGGRRPVIWFSTYCCAPAEHLPASSNPAFPHPPSSADRQQQGRRPPPWYEHELARHGGEQDKRQHMIHDRRAAGPHRRDDFDVEQQHADRNDKVADGDWHLPVRDEGNREHRLGERHVQEKDNHVEESKRDDQVHDTWLSSGESSKAKRQARAAPRRAKFRSRSTKLK